MKKVLLLLSCFAISLMVFSQAGPPHPKYNPTIKSFGNAWTRGAFDSALHIPHLPCLCVNDTDTTPQIFWYGDSSLVAYYKSHYFILAGNGSGNFDSAYWAGLINALLPIGDTASMLASYLRANVAAASYYPLSSNPSNYSTLPNVANSLQVINLAGAHGIQVGLYSARPAASGSTNFYVATDSLKIYYDNGGWITISSSSGGAGGALTISGDATGTISGTNIPVSVTAIRGATIPSLTNGFLKQSSGSWVYDNSVYITGNQSIFFSPSGDISGTATSPTSLMPALTVTGILDQSLPTLAPGLLRNTGSSFIWDNSSGGGSANVFDTVINVPNTANYTIPTTTKNITLLLSDLTGQANRNLVLPTGQAGQHIIVKNRNTLASGFAWTFTNVTVHDFSDGAITGLQNVTVYQLVFDGTYYDIIN